MLRRCTEGLESFITDDLQFADSASLQVGAYAHARFHSAGTFPLIIDCCRRSDFGGEVLTLTKRLETAGLAMLMHLEPLPPEAVGELLDSLALPGAGSLTGEMTRYTGGNPLFITETLKHLMESGSLERGWPERLPPPGRVRQLIQQRLERLSPLTLQLAQVAALALMEFNLELAGEVLEVSPLSFAEPLRELEAAQILRGERFTHDLVFEAVKGSIPSALGALLHRRLAQQLERRRAAPATIAQHWLDGERDPARGALPAVGGAGGRVPSAPGGSGHALRARRFHPGVRWRAGGGGPFEEPGSLGVRRGRAAALDVRALACTPSEGRRAMDLVLFIGLQGSGKSSFYRERFAATHVHVSKDLWPNARKREARQRRLIAEALDRGRPGAGGQHQPARGGPGAAHRAGTGAGGAGGGLRLRVGPGDLPGAQCGAGGAGAGAGEGDPHHLPEAAMALVRRGIRCVVPRTGAPGGRLRREGMEGGR